MQELSEFKNKKHQYTKLYQKIYKKNMCGVMS